METTTYTKEQLEVMPKADLTNVLTKAVKIEGTILVRDKDGNPKYDDPSQAGNYGEDI